MLNESSYCVGVPKEPVIVVFETPANITCAVHINTRLFLARSGDVETWRERERLRNEKKVEGVKVGLGLAGGRILNRD